MLLYTDGVTEATSPRGEMFGKERLALLVKENAQHSAAELLQTIRQFLTNFTDGKPLADDVTLLACKFSV